MSWQMRKRVWIINRLPSWLCAFTKARPSVIEKAVHPRRKWMGTPVSISVARNSMSPSSDFNGTVITGMLSNFGQPNDPEVTSGISFDHPKIRGQACNHPRRTQVTVHRVTRHGNRRTRSHGGPFGLRRENNKTRAPSWCTPTTG